LESNIHIIILCGGEGKRWKNYLGIKKHFIEIEGERLLDRTIRLINKYKNTKTTIFVVANDENYLVQGTKLFIPKKNSYNSGADKFLDSKELWNKQCRTIVLMGDVWFSENCMKSIMEHTGKEWVVFGRRRKSKITGCPYPEIFGQSFFPEHLEEHENNLHKIVKAYHRGKIRRCIGWEHYRCMIGLEPTNKHVVKNKFFDVDDFTEDFDIPLDYRSWIIYRKKSSENSRFRKIILSLITAQVFLGFLVYGIKNKINSQIKD